MRRSYIYGGSFIAAAVLVALGPPAIAAPDSKGSVQGLEEVVVVARRVEERLQDVPITVTAVTAVTLKETQISTGTDLIKLVPTLSVQQGATGPGVNYALRGIRSGVVTYFDEVPTNSATVDDMIWDLSSVQALAGPQGTLFGRNGTGGAILFVPQRPTKALEGYVTAGYGNYNQQLLTAVINVPASDKLQFRFGGRLDKHDPMVENINTGGGMQSRNRYQLRAAMVFEPTDSISNYTVVHYARRNEKPVALIASDAANTALSTAFYGATFNTTSQALQDRLGIRKINSPFQSHTYATNYGVSNIFTDALGHGLTFKYIAGYRHTYSDDVSSKSGFTVPIEIGRGGQDPGKVWSHEVQLLGKIFDNRLSWTVGGFSSNSSSYGISSYQLYGTPGSPFQDSTNITHFGTSKNRSTAFYGQATLAVTDKLNLTVGARHTKDSASLAGTGQTPQFFFFGPEKCGLTPGAIGVNFAACTQVQSGTTSANTYNVSVDYHLSDSVLLYATTRKGYNGGGFNASVPTTPTPGAPQGTYDPEFVTDYEVGAKTEGSLGGMPIRANFSVYQDKYTKIQRSSFGVTSTGTYAGISNGPKATIFGAQVESAIKPVPDLTINFNYGYLHTQYDEGAPGFPKGNTFGQAPEKTMNISALYHHDLAQGGAAVATLSYAYQSEITFMDNQTALLHSFQKGYGISDARVGWEKVMNSPVDVTFFVKNLTDVTYAQEKQDQAQLLGFTGTVYNDPRTYGIELHYSFGG